MKVIHKVVAPVATKVKNKLQEEFGMIKNWGIIMLCHVISYYIAQEKCVSLPN